MSKKYAFGALTTDELIELNQMKLASLTDEQAKAIVEEQAEDIDEDEDDFGAPKTAEDREAAGFAMHDGFESTISRFNQYCDEGLDPVASYEKVAAENAQFAAETEGLLEEPVSAEEDLLAQAVQKMAAEDPEALAAAAGQWLENNGYEITESEEDENGDLEDGEEEEAQA